MTRGGAKFCSAPKHFLGRGKSVLEKPPRRPMQANGGILQRQLCLERAILQHRIFQRLMLLWPNARHTFRILGSRL
jgi:hypothetical protein